MQRHRITLVLSTIFKVRGGIQRFNQMLCLALDELSPALGLDVEVISQDDSLEDYRAHGSPWRHVALIPGGGKLGVIRKTVGLCARRRPDLLLIGLLGMTPVGLMARPFVRRGFGFIAHGFECWDDHPQFDARRSRRIAARRASFVFAVSDYTRRALARTAGIPLDSILLLPNTLEPSFESRDAPEPPEARPHELLSVSRLWSDERMKGVDTTIAVFARLAGRHPDWRLRIVGKGSDKPRLQALALELGLQERAVFEQDLTDEDLAERYRRCAVFVLPSGQEGFGIVFLEAMNSSKPCIGGDAGGTPEVIEHDRTGYLVPYGDAGALESAMQRLMADGARRRQFGRAGRARLLERFTFDRFRERLERHLRRLLEPA